ncbi:MAG: hypothetical protein QXD23_03015 [Candidatus Micrarchaeaceae archaeon]
MEPEKVYDNKTMSILLITFSIILLSSGILSVEFFSTQYGLGVAAILTATATNTSVIHILQYEASQNGVFYQAILESYIITSIGFILFAMTFTLWLHKQNGYESFLKVYFPLHLILVCIYLLLLFITYSAFDFNLYSLNLDITYISIIFSIILDLYIGYKIYGSTVKKHFSGIKISPDKPYTNMVNLREKIFYLFVGNLGIVDKHFNSQALLNLYRLIYNNKNIKKITIISSNEMLDSSFSKEYRDLKNELEKGGIILEVKLMNEVDTIQQHERFIFDDVLAYKIPPFNIINKKSEHIIKMSRKDAVARFQELLLKSVKIN